jgi:uncharacterized membrane protein
MDSNIHDWLNLIVRWIHVIFGIMWIGSSIFFNWLDSSFEPLKGEKEEGTVGEVWMVHGGGFYHVKKKYLKASELPDTLYWFKWEAGFTFISGITLLSIVYYMTGGIYLIDSNVSNITEGQAISLCVGLLILSWGIYDTVWNSKLAKNPAPLAIICFLSVIGIAYGLSQVLSARAAYMHIGAMLGTIMAANVWMRILPAQNVMMKAVTSGQPLDPTPGLKAKMRSKHNNYMTYPVIFIMISNHFPNAYAHHLNWVILAILIIASVIIKHFLNISEHFKYWFPRALGVGVVALTSLFFVNSIPDSKNVDIQVKDEHNSINNEVKFSQAREVITKRCMACHSSKPTDDMFKVAPAGVIFDTPEQIQSKAERIKIRAVTTKTMPLGNKTQITDEERQILARWIEQGAKID